MTETRWTTGACILCAINCGLDIGTQGRRITKVKGDRSHPGSRGSPSSIRGGARPPTSQTCTSTRASRGSEEALEPVAAAAPWEATASSAG